MPGDSEIVGNRRACTMYKLEKIDAKYVRNMFHCLIPLQKTFLNVYGLYCNQISFI